MKHLKADGNDGCITRDPPQTTPAPLQVRTTFGVLTPDQAFQLREAGLTAYNHNLDTPCPLHMLPLLAGFAGFAPAGCVWAKAISNWMLQRTSPVWGANKRNKRLIGQSNSSPEQND
jgi:hypothetical protein